MLHTRPLALPFTARRLAPGPLIVTLLVTCIWPLANVIGAGCWDGEVDGVVVVGNRERLAQRAGATVVGICDDDGGCLSNWQINESCTYQRAQKTNSCFHR